MKLLITGGAGFIGSNFVRHLLAHTSHQLVNLDNLTYAGSLASLSGCLENPRHTFIQADLCDPLALQDLFRKHPPDAVIHLAAESHVDRSIDGPAAFIHTNILGTYHLLQASLNHFRTLSPTDQQKFRFLHVSTDEVFGSLAPDDPAFSETTPYAPHSPYSASKAASDHLARAWHDTYGLPVLVTNCSNNYGPYQFPEKLIPVVVLKALRNQHIPIYGQGENIRDWLHVSDHCTALLAVLEKGQIGQTYTIGGDNPLTNLQLVHHLCTLLDELRPAAQPYATLITHVPDRPGHDLRYAVDATKIRTQLGWHPTQSPHTGFRQTVQWYLDNQPWCQNILGDA